MNADVSSKRNILVTGGTSGVGRAIATGFAASGHSVIICARSADDCARVADDISRGNEGSCIGLACDISRHDQIEELAAGVATRFGVLHALINNAGAVAPGPMADIEEADWDRVVDVNLKAAFFLTQKLASCLRQAGTEIWPAAVINIGSLAGARVAPRPHFPYSAAKAGLNILTQALAREFAPHHVNVNTIALGVFPDNSRILEGYTDDMMTAIRQGIPAGRFGEARDIIELTRFLTSPASSYITGATIPLDGGMHI